MELFLTEKDSKKKWEKKNFLVLISTSCVSISFDFSSNGEGGIRKLAHFCVSVRLFGHHVLVRSLAANSVCVCVGLF